MKSVARPFLVLCCLATLVPAQDEEKLLLTNEDFSLPVGTVGLQRMKMRMKCDKLTIKVGEIELNAKMENTSVEDFKAEYVAPNKYRYLRIRSFDHNLMEMQGQPAEPDVERDPLEGVPLIVELVDGDWVVSLAKGEPNKKQKEALEEFKDELNTDSDPEMYGKKPRQIGESWEVDAALLPGGEDMDMKGKVTLTLKGVRKYKGLRCAVITGTVNAVMKVGEDEEMDIDVKMKAKVEVLRSLDLYEDVKFLLSGTLEFDGTVETPQGDVKMNGKGPMELSGSVVFGKEQVEAALKAIPKVAPKEDALPKEEGAPADQ